MACYSDKKLGMPLEMVYSLLQDKLLQVKFPDIISLSMRFCTCKLREYLQTGHAKKSIIASNIVNRVYMMKLLLENSVV
jgi:hypothetical protein